jgi:hypothetical protein
VAGCQPGSLPGRPYSLVYENNWPQPPALGDGLGMTKDMLSGVLGAALGLRETSGSFGIGCCNGSTWTILPSWRIIMEGKRILTW